MRHSQLKSLFIICSLFLFGCPTPEPEPDPVPTCDAIEEDYSQSVNGFDFRFGSPFQNQVITNFKFEQTITNYTNNCKPSVGVINLKIQNLTNKRITMDYLIQYRLNAGGWDYQGVAVINANSIYDAGEIMKRTSRVSQGTIQIVSQSLRYD